MSMLNPELELCKADIHAYGNAVAHPFQVFRISSFISFMKYNLVKTFD